MNDLGGALLGINLAMLVLQLTGVIFVAQGQIRWGFRLGVAAAIYAVVVVALPDRAWGEHLQEFEAFAPALSKGWVILQTLIAIFLTALAWLVGRIWRSKQTKQ